MGGTPGRCRRRGTGLTLAELMVALALLAILSTLAWPVYQQHLLRARRADGHAALARVQQAQERHRNQQPVYASSLGIGGLNLPVLSANGHYALATAAIAGSEASAYRVSAAASGAQAQDSDCRHLAIEVIGGNQLLRSGPTADLGNDSASSRRCWNQ
ncbi:MAG: type IV pilin protein [Leptothrix sp. (in: b-proteobacteria)]